MTKIEPQVVVTFGSGSNPQYEVVFRGESYLLDISVFEGCEDVAPFPGGVVGLVHTPQGSIEVGPSELEDVLFLAAAEVELCISEPLTLVDQFKEFKRSLDLVKKDLKNFYLHKSKSSDLPGDQGEGL